LCPTILGQCGKTPDNTARNERINKAIRKILADRFLEIGYIVSQPRQAEIHHGKNRKPAKTALATVLAMRDYPTMWRDSNIEYYQQRILFASSVVNEMDAKLPASCKLAARGSSHRPQACRGSARDGALNHPRC
jgi:hypothetical protein